MKISFEIPDAICDQLKAMAAGVGRSDITVEDMIESEFAGLLVEENQKDNPLVPWARERYIHFAEKYKTL